MDGRKRADLLGLWGTHMLNQVPRQHVEVHHERIENLFAVHAEALAIVARHREAEEIRNKQLKEKTKADEKEEEEERRSVRVASGAHASTSGVCCSKKMVEAGESEVGEEKKEEEEELRYWDKADRRRPPKKFEYKKKN